MRTILIALTFALIALPAWAQTRDQNIARCVGKDPDLSIGACTALIQSGREPNSNLALAYSSRGSAYDHKGLHDQAIADFNQAIAFNPSDAVSYINRGVAYAHKGLHDQAFADYNQAIALNPGDAIAYKDRGGGYEAKGLHDQAIADYTHAIALTPSDAGAYAGRGDIYKAIGRYDQAIADYDQAILLSPSYAEARANRDLVLATLARGEHVDRSPKVAPIAKEDPAPAPSKGPTKPANAKPLAPLLKGDFAAEVEARIKRTKEYSAILSFSEAKSRTYPNWASSALGRRADALLKVMRSDALYTRPVRTPGGVAIQYTVAGQAVTDTGILVKDLNTDKEYRDFIAGAIASVISSSSAVTDFLAEMKRER